MDKLPIDIIQIYQSETTKCQFTRSIQIQTCIQLIYDRKLAIGLLHRMTNTMWNWQFSSTIQILKYIIIRNHRNCQLTSPFCKEYVIADKVLHSFSDKKRSSFELAIRRQAIVSSDGYSFTTIKNEKLTYILFLFVPEYVISDKLTNRNNCQLVNKTHSKTDNCRTHTEYLVTFNELRYNQSQIVSLISHKMLITSVTVVQTNVVNANTSNWLFGGSILLENWHFL